MLGRDTRTKPGMADGCCRGFIGMAIQLESGRVLFGCSSGRMPSAYPSVVPAA